MFLSKDYYFYFFYISSRSKTKKNLLETEVSELVLCVDRNSLFFCAHMLIYFPQILVTLRNASWGGGWGVATQSPPTVVHVGLVYGDPRAPYRRQKALPQNSPHLDLRCLLATSVRLLKTSRWRERLEPVHP